MSIKIEEVLDILCYGLTKQAGEVLKKHWYKYHDWNRLKDILQKELILQNAENYKMRSTIKKLAEEVDRLKQVDAFAGMKSQSK